MPLRVAGMTGVKVLATYEVNELKDTGLWYEGSSLVGYWPEGKSYIFSVGYRHLAISKGFIERTFDHDVRG